MNEGRDRAAWAVVSEVLSVMVNLWSSPKGRRFSGSDFDPYRQTKKAAAPIEMLRMVFVERKVP
jgi:hypothetical protein